MTRKRLTRMCAAVAVLTVTLSATAALAQAPAAGRNDMAVHRQMMTDQKAMMAKMAAADQKLADLVARMNATKGEEQVAAVTAVLNELVAQRKQMHESCGMMRTPAETKTDASEADHAGHHPAQ